MKLIPNFPPTKLTPQRLAVIGEAPGQYEALMAKPFVGPSGKELWDTLLENEVTYENCLVANVCQIQPPSDNINAFRWDGFEIQDGLARLRRDIEQSDPNCCLLLGRTAVKAAGIDMPVKPSKEEPRTINNMRGSIFKCIDLDSPMYGRKCVICYHPAAIVRNYAAKPLFRFDVARACEESLSPECILPEDLSTIKVQLSYQAAMEEMSKIVSGMIVATDIEGGCDGITCVGFSTSPTYGFSFNPNDYSNGQSYAIWQEINRIYSSYEIGKVLQQSTYETFVLAWTYGIHLRNVVWDTMCSGPEIYPELPKALGVQASLWTRWPYFKFERKIGTGRTLQIYNVKDCLSTHEVYLAHQQVLTNPSGPHTQENLDHFKFNMELLPFFNYMSYRGMRYNTQLLEEKKADIAVQMEEVAVLCRALTDKPDFNPGSSQQCQHQLYKVRRLPAVKKKAARNDEPKDDTLTADVNALLSLLAKTNDPLVYQILRWRALEGVRKQLVPCDDDGRMRAAFSNPGTKTHRSATHKSNTGRGLNLQTITNVNRILFEADPGCLFGQADLAGADSWTVAAACAMCGDDTMLRDLQAGIKPAQAIVALWTYGEDVAKLPQKEMLALVKELKGQLAETGEWSWKYFAAKKIHHGTNYKMGPITMSRNILQDSWKKQHQPLFIKSSTCGLVQKLYHRRYPGIARWWDWLKQHVKTTSSIPTAAGPHVVFSSPYDETSFGELCSHAPQTNTTYVTNRAAYNLFYDPENRRDNGSFIIEPLHQVHDSLNFQFFEEDLPFAKRKIPTYFDFTVNLSGYQIRIDYEGTYGRNWLEQGEAFGGGTL